VQSELYGDNLRVWTSLQCSITDVIVDHMKRPETGESRLKDVGAVWFHDYTSALFPDPRGAIDEIHGLVRSSEWKTSRFCRRIGVPREGKIPGMTIPFVVSISPKANIESIGDGRNCVNIVLEYHLPCTIRVYPGNQTWFSSHVFESERSFEVRDVNVTVRRAARVRSM
jgi:hypothetical protein